MSSRDGASTAVSPDIDVVDEARIHRLIRDRGGRVTGPTRLVVTLLAGTTDHLTAEDLIGEIDRRALGVAPSTVYRVLQRLDQLGIVEIIHPNVGPAFYHLGDTGHAHLVCTKCRIIIDVPDTALASLTRTTRRAHDFTIDTQQAAIVGRCGRCST